MKNTFHKNKDKKFLDDSGFMAAEFIFAFTMVIGCGIVIFALTFSLTTVEIAQYIVWSSARSYAAANFSKDDSRSAAQEKYKNLTAAFPLLTGNGSSSSWYEMSPSTSLYVDDEVETAMKAADGDLEVNNSTASGEVRHPWYGVQADIDLKLFKNMQIPFLGKITSDPDSFKFQVRGLLLRHPSYQECKNFFKERYTQGIFKIHGESPEWKNGFSVANPNDAYIPIEDNGC